MIENEVNVLLTNEGEISGFNKLKEYGYFVYHFPMIRTEPNPNAEPLKEGEISFLESTFDILIFISGRIRASSHASNELSTASLTAVIMDLCNESNPRKCLFFSKNSDTAICF